MGEDPIRSWASRLGGRGPGTLYLQKAECLGRQVRQVGRLRDHAHVGLRANPANQPGEGPGPILRGTSGQRAPGTAAGVDVLAADDSEPEADPRHVALVKLIAHVLFEVADAVREWQGWRAAGLGLLG